MCDFLSVIYSNLGPMSHRLVTVHPLHTMDRQSDDNPCLSRSI